MFVSTGISHHNRYELLFMDDDDVVNNQINNLIKEKPTKSVTALMFSRIAANSVTTPQVSRLQLKPGSNKTPKKHKADDTNNKPSNQKDNKINLKLKQQQSEKENKQLSSNNVCSKKPFIKLNSISNDANDQQQPLLVESITVGKTTGVLNRKRNNGHSARPQQQQHSANFKHQQSNTRRSNGPNYNNFLNQDAKNNAAAQNTEGFVSGSGAIKQSQGNNRQLKRSTQPRYRNYFEGGSTNRIHDFDRQSESHKTGIRNVDKRNGGGVGGQQNQSKDVNANESATYSNQNHGNHNNNSGDGDNILENGETTTNPDANETVTGTKEDSAIIDTEVKEWTLDEWKAQQQQRAKPKYNIRKAGEGEDTSQWKKMVVLINKNKKEQDTEEELLEYDPATYPQRIGRQQRILDIQFNFSDSRSGSGRGGYGRGGRGGTGNHVRCRPLTDGNLNDKFCSNGGNKNRNRRQFNDDQNRFYKSRQERTAAPKVNDERQFPTLT